jgi:predicted transposase YbfD/YdcC
MKEKVMLENNDFIGFLRIIPDPRVERCKKYSLESILFIALTGMLCGADSFIEIADVADANQEWLRKYIDLPSGIPSHDTICRVFSLIDKNKFCECFSAWTKSMRKEHSDDVIAIDGKSLCGAYGESLKGMAHMLHAWSVENGLCIAQQAVKDKSNEITALKPLLEMLDLKGCIVTVDAIHSHKKTAALISEKEGTYALPIKDNEKNFKEEIETLFADAFKNEFKGFDADHFKTLEKEHGRIEERNYWVLDATDLPSVKEWSNLKAVALCQRERTLKGKTTLEKVYYALSFDVDAKKFAKVARNHWQVENNLHWVLDVVFEEDKQKYKDKTMAQNLSCLRKIALNLLKKDSRKASLQAKRLRAACNITYREEILKNLFIMR